MRWPCLGNPALGATDSPFVVMIRTVISPTSIATAIREMWDGDRGMNYAEKMAFEILPFADRIRIPVLLAGHAYIRRHAFSRMLNADEDEILWNVLDVCFRKALGEKAISTVQVMQLASTWKGQTAFLGWNDVKSSLERIDPFLHDGLAYVFAHRLAKIGKQDESQTIFQELSDTSKDSRIRKLAASELSVQQ